MAKTMTTDVGLWQFGDDTASLAPVASPVSLETIAFTAISAFAMASHGHLVRLPLRFSGHGSWKCAAFDATQSCHGTPQCKSTLSSEKMKKTAKQSPNRHLTCRREVIDRKDGGK
jgi:hypothetical protein